MKTVAIVGAGPSGLVAAKTLLRSKKCQYEVRIFEKTADVGGLWAVYKDKPYDGMLNPNMPTNLSRFNIGFSDLAWTSIGLEGHVPYWPRAWQVGQYIRAYVDKYIPKDVFAFNTKVTFADVDRDEVDKTLRWRLRWISSLDAQPAEEEQVFDHLIIGTGLFAASSMPNFEGLASTGVKIVHSTKLRKLRDVAPDDPLSTGTVLVVGGGMSGGDVTTVLASQLSDALYSPTSDGSQYAGVKLVQLCPSPAYALPLAASMDSCKVPAPNFLPLDLAMYDLSKRPPGPIEMTIGKSPVEVIETVHKAFRNLVGDQADLESPGLKYDASNKAPYVTLTEQYSGFVRAGQIKVVSGRLTDLIPTGPGKAEAIVTCGDGAQIIQDITGVVYATGFSPQPALDFLGPELKKALLHDPKHNRLPVLLDEHATISHDLPGFAIIGYHEGAFWGSMEMEARLVEHRWSDKAWENGHINGGDEHVSLRDKLLDLRVAMAERESTVPQYWMGDYVGLMETISRQIGLQRNDFDWPERSGPVTIYRYLDKSDDPSETISPLEEFLAILRKSKTKGMFAPRAAFLAMHGHWQIRRVITSILDTMPSGELTGTASFHPRFPTDDSFDFEYLYTERGSFQMNNGMTMQATRQYVYRYQESSDQLTVWFVKADAKTVDYLYHGLAFDVTSRQNGWLAKADHLCIADMYKSDYLFTFQGANLRQFNVTHAVKGPKKNYVSETIYTR